MFGKKKQPPIKSLIAQGSCIEGNLKFTDGLRIDGEVIGDIRAAEGSSSILVISESATVTGYIHADHVIINGRVMGPVHASELLELQHVVELWLLALRWNRDGGEQRDDGVGEQRSRNLRQSGGRV